MSEITDNLRIVESPVQQSSDGQITYSVDHAGWFPDDVTTISNLVLTVKDTGGNTLSSKTGSVSINSLVATFTLQDLPSGSYKVFGKATANTGDVDTWYFDVYVPY